MLLAVEQFLCDSIKRTCTELSEVLTTSEEFRMGLDNMERLFCLERSVQRTLATEPAPVDQTPTEPAPEPKKAKKKAEPKVEEPAPIEDPIPEEESPFEEAPTSAETTYTIVEVRSLIASTRDECRKQGIEFDIPTIIQGYGVNQLSAIDPARYPELVEQIKGFLPNA